MNETTTEQKLVQEELDNSNEQATEPEQTETTAADAPFVSQADCDEPTEDWEVLHVHWDGLSSAQNIALVALTGGCTKAEASRMAGVHRNTLYNWLGQEVFSQSLRHAQVELRDAARARMESMAGQAADCIEMAMRRGDARTALQLVKMLGTLDGLGGRTGRLGMAGGRSEASRDVRFQAELGNEEGKMSKRDRGFEQGVQQLEGLGNALAESAAYCAGLLVGLLGLLGQMFVNSFRWATTSIDGCCRSGAARMAAAKQSLGTRRKKQTRGERAKWHFPPFFVPCFAQLRRAKAIGVLLVTSVFQRPAT